MTDIYFGLSQEQVLEGIKQAISRNTDLRANIAALLKQAEEDDKKDPYEEYEKDMKRSEEEERERARADADKGEREMPDMPDPDDPDDQVERLYYAYKEAWWQRRKELGENFKWHWER